MERKPGNKIEAVIFDMDGLMFDTERVAAQGWKMAGEQLGFHISETKLRQMRGRNVIAGRALFQEWYNGRISYDEARDIRTAYVTEYIEEKGTPVKDGLPELFRYLKENGCRKAIATSTQRETAEWYFAHASLPFDFEVSVCGTEIKNGKPAPDVFLTAAAKLGLPPERCLVLEDSFSGVRAGAAAGCSVIMVPDLQEPDEETASLCLAVCRTLREVPHYL